MTEASSPPEVQPAPEEPQPAAPEATDSESKKRKAEDEDEDEQEPPAQKVKQDEAPVTADATAEGGKVKQTDNAHLSPLPSTEAEANVESTKDTNQTEGTDEEEGEVKEDKAEPVKEAGETQEPPAAPVPVSAPAPAEASVSVPVSASAPASILPPGVPVGVPMGVPAALPVQQTNAQPTPSRAVSETVVETQDIASHLVGRIIGKGGEQIRDIQARADCKVDVDQNVPHGAPKIITYQGPREKVDFAKSLVSMLCQDNWKNITLPIGFAKQKLLHVPSTVIGKIIGRGGEMIKELQSKSYAKIQVDHNSGQDTGFRSVTVIGNELSVKRGEEMINLIIQNPLADASNSIDMLIKEKAQGVSEWGSGPPYTTMPNNGVGMQRNSYGSGGNSYDGGGNSYGSYGNNQHQNQYQSQQRSSYGGGYNQYGQSNSGGGGGLESEIFYVAKNYMGRIIGKGGVTINDLQKRSGCDIQINQNVPQGQDCEVNIKGVRSGIENAKQMLNEIIQMGPNHPYAGGGGSSGGGYHHQQQQQYGGYQQPQQPSYGQMQQPQMQQPQIQPQYNAQPVQQQQYGGYQQQQQPVYAQQQYGQPQQPAMQQQQPVYNNYQQPQQQQQSYNQPQQYAQQSHPVYQAPAAPVAPSPWKTATAPDGQIYYYNEKTNQTTWDKPADMP